jgi:hypothetical protein
MFVAIHNRIRFDSILGVEAMKVNKTLSLDYSIVQELQLMKNQSAFVNAAILKRLGGMMSVDPEITTNQLMSALMSRTDCDPFIKKALKLKIKPKY